MSKNYFSPGQHQKLIDARQKGRELRAARLIREQSTCSSHSPQARSSILKEIELLVEDDEYYLKAMQEHTDAQEAQRQARQQWIQGE